MALQATRSLVRFGNGSNNHKFGHLRTLVTAGGKEAPKSSTPAKGPDPGNVPGLSSAVLSVPPGEVGPHASKQAEYKNPEYFCYNEFSYFEAENEMLKYRLPQPSSIKQN
ncbi:uncharacterized protein LOC134542163 [Bacillus rossius redtenbacheri]|uniref:uncharacterized protein LOC134542163 n=1 Tax=Bacillus rossius redtenbacheri TaxID=93214 RepID=UPI002FDD72FD